MRRVIIGAAICALPTMVWVPKIAYFAGSGRRAESERAYSFLFDIQRNTEVDLKQLLLNVIVAAVLGGVIGTLPLWLIRRGSLVILAILGIGIGATAVIVPLTARKEAPGRARADEAYAERLHEQWETPAAIMKLREAAYNWQVAGDRGEESRVNAKAAGYARQVSAAAARADEKYARQLVKEGRIDVAKTKLANAAKNWHDANEPNEERRIREWIPTLRDAFDEFLDDPPVSPIPAGRHGALNTALTPNSAEEVKRAEPVRPPSPLSSP